MVYKRQTFKSLHLFWLINMAGTFCTSGQALIKAGKNVSVDFTTTKANDVDVYIEQAESEINVFTRYNWTDAFAGLDADTSKILEKLAASLTAIELIIYDMSGFTSRVEAEDMINVLRDQTLRMFGIIRDKKEQSFLNDPATGSV